MANINHLLKQADIFYLHTLYAQDKQLEQYARAIVNEMLGLANGAVVAVRHAQSSTEHKNSPGLSAISERMPQVVRLLRSFGSDSGESFIASLGTLLDGLSFYTSSSNAGTGQDIATTVSSEGYTPPAYYVKNLQDLLGKLKGAMKYKPHSPWEPTGPEPMARDLLRQQNKQTI
jgi:hypothetical protein